MKEKHYFIIWNGLGYSVIYGYIGDNDVYWPIGCKSLWCEDYRVCQYLGVLDVDARASDEQKLLWADWLCDKLNAPQDNQGYCGTGFVSPSGKIYEASDENHSDTARCLVALVYPKTYLKISGDTMSCERYLEETGWIFVRSSVSFHIDGKFTDQQRGVIRRWLHDKCGYVTRSIYAMLQAHKVKFADLKSN